MTETQDLPSDTHAGRLIEDINEARRAYCESVINEAEDEAERMIDRAYAQARRDVHRAVAAERQRVAQYCHRVRAELETVRREQAHQRANEFLDKALTRLNERLAHQWQANANAWIDAVLLRAEAILPRETPWTVAVAADASPAVLDTIRTRLAHAGVHVAAVDLEPTISAGLRIHAGPVQLDATRAGLLADRAQIESRLLGLLEAHRGHAA